MCWKKVSFIYSYPSANIMIIMIVIGFHQLHLVLWRLNEPSCETMHHLRWASNSLNSSFGAIVEEGCHCTIFRPPAGYIVIRSLTMAETYQHCDVIVAVTVLQASSALLAR